MINSLRKLMESLKPSNVAPTSYSAAHVQLVVCKEKSTSERLLEFNPWSK